MELLDRVRVKVEKKEYAKCGVHKGDIGILMLEPRGDDIWDVYFNRPLIRDGDEWRFIGEEVDLGMHESEFEVVDDETANAEWRAKYGEFLVEKKV